MKKYIVFGLLAVSFILSPVFVSAQSTSALSSTQLQIQQLQQELIKRLFALVQQLQRQLQALQTGSTTPQSPAPQQPPAVSQNPNRSNDGKCGLTINSPTPNSSVSFPLIVTGAVDNQNASQLGCSWQTFEGIAGTAQFYIFLNEENNKGWTSIGDSVLMRLESSATGKSSFSLAFNYPEGGFRMNAPIKIVFVEENIAVIRPSLTFELPLVLR